MVVGKAPDLADVLADSLLAYDVLFIFSCRLSYEFDLLFRKRQHGSFDLQEFAHISGGFQQISLDIDQGSKHDVPHRVIMERTAFAEPVAHQVHQILIRARHCQHDLSEISDCGDIQFFLKLSCTAAIIADGNDCRHIKRE